MTTQVLELLTYRLQPGITAPAFLALDDQTRPALHGQPGLLSRELASDGESWTEVVRWASQAHADAAGQAIMVDPRAAPLMAAIDPQSLTMRFQPLVWHKRD